MSNATNNIATNTTNNINTINTTKIFEWKGGWWCFELYGVSSHVSAVYIEFCETKKWIQIHDWEFFSQVDVWKNLLENFEADEKVKDFLFLILFLTDKLS